MALASPALAGYDPAPGQSFEAALEAGQTARATARGLASTSLVRGLKENSLESCSFEQSAAQTCDRVDLAPCRGELVGLYGQIEPSNDGPTARAMTDVARNALVDAAVWLSLARQAATRGACRRIVSPGRHAVKTAIDREGRLLRVRPLEPRLGATVIVAPGGGIEQWLLLQVSYRLEMSFFLCSGGPDHGQSCDTTARCDAPGSCVVNPFNARLASQFAPAYQWSLAGAEPASFAAERVGPNASHAPLLLLAGGTDLVLNPGLAGALADAYGMRRIGPGTRRGPHGYFLQWPDLDHSLVQDSRVRQQAYDFLASKGRTLPRLPLGESR